jgi:CheY-like chemotaxis protein
LERASALYFGNFPVSPLNQDLKTADYFLVNKRRKGQLNMPLAPAPQPQPNPVEGVPEHSPARVLVADDSIISQRAAVRMLDSLGLRADASANGREAVEMLLTLPYDLVLMDCQMPLMNGLEAASEIRRREPPDRRTPIVAMSAEIGAACLDDCLASGIDDILLKPVRIEKLRAAVLRWLPAEPVLPAGIPHARTRTFVP